MSPSGQGNQKRSHNALYEMSCEARALDAYIKSEGKCRTADPDIFFPPLKEPEESMKDYDERVQANVVLAKVICEGCVIREECLEFAKMTKQKTGVWGGEDFGQSNPNKRAVRREKARLKKETTQSPQQ